MTAALTADLYDLFESQCNSCEIQFSHYGRRRAFFGKISTVSCRDDNILLRRYMEQRSDGGVLVVDGGGSLASALIGDIIAEIGRKNGWAGIIIYGAVRDVRALASLDFGVVAVGSNPKKSTKNGTGVAGLPVLFGGATFVPGQWVYCDEDGILVAQNKLL